MSQPITPEPANVSARLDRLPVTSYQRKIFVVIAFAWLFDSVDLGMMTFLLAPVREHFSLDAASAGFVASFSFIGMFIGAAVSGMLGDRFGRKIVFQYSILIWAIGSLLCAMSVTVTMFVILRFIIGFGMGAEFPIAQSMVSELIPSKNRGRYLALLEGFWPLGFICAGLLAYLILPIGGWRWVLVAQGIPGLYVIWLRRKLPESPRWYEVKGRHREADAVVSEFERQVERLTGQPLPPIDVSQQSVMAERMTFVDSFRQLWSSAFAKRTLMVWLLWFFYLFGYYGITTWVSALMIEKSFSITSSTLYTILISLAAIPGFALASILIEKWGRKPTLVLYIIGASVTAFFYGSTNELVTMILWGLGMQFFLFGVWSCLYAYTPELYPTRMRATGCGFASAIGRIGSLLAPSIAGYFVGMNMGVNVYSLGIGAFVIAVLAVMLLGPETKGRTLEEISQ
jgi:putative MFS transporter